MRFSCDQQRLRPVCAYAQSDQSLCSSLDYTMIKVLTEVGVEQTHLSLHLSKYHIVGRNRTSQLICSGELWPLAMTLTQDV